MKNIVKGLLIIILLIILGNTFVTAFEDWLEGDTTPMVESEYMICSGDRLWDIASEFKPNSMSYEQYLYELRKVNNDTDLSVIYPGQVIKILKVKESE